MWILKPLMGDGAAGVSDPGHDNDQIKEENVSALIEILLDVSGSMESSVGGSVDQEGGSWARSIFRVVDQLVKHDVSSENQVFALGYGAKNHPVVFDLLKILRISGHSGSQHKATKSEMLNDILNILERNGASYVREWASMDMLENSISGEDVEVFLTMLKKNPDNFTRVFVRDCLPVECRHRYSGVRATVAENRNLATYIPLLGEWVHGHIDHKAQVATQKSIREAVDKGKALIWKTCGTIVHSDAIVNVHRASEILHGCIDEENLTKDQVDKLMEYVEPFIYGPTPMISALREAKKLMSLRKYKHHHKVLFVLSDGQSTDGDTPPDLSHLNVNVVSCYITNSSVCEPKRLYSRKCQDWAEGAKFMFDLSSSVSTQLLPRTIFVKRGWKIDIEDNKTKLFLQVNHPDLIDEVCAFARDVVCCQDALSDVIASIDLDLYINKANQGFGAKEKEGGTCYANASAAVLHLAMKRIVGRDGGYPDFFNLRAELIAGYGKSGANTLQVLQEVCPKYRLQCQEVDIKVALKAVAAKRPVIARFRLTDSEWDKFSNFYRQNPAGILSQKDLDKRKRPAGSRTGGHAVVLTSFNTKGLTLMNSWGSDWANNGFFSVENADVLGLEFVDVYWTLNDLHPSEIETYEREGPAISQKLMASLTGLQRAKYKCPLCHQESLVRKFTGQLVRATCPKCHGVFNTNSHDAHDLVLNMYLTSLVTEE